MKKSSFLIMAKLCPLKSVDLEQFYSSVVWEKKNAFAYEGTGSSNVSCHLNNSISSGKKIISQGEKNQRLKVSDTVTHKIAYECAISLS